MQGKWQHKTTGRIVEVCEYLEEYNLVIFPAEVCGKYHALTRKKFGEFWEPIVLGGGGQILEVPNKCMVPSFDRMVLGEVRCVDGDQVGVHCDAGYKIYRPCDVYPVRLS